MMAPRVMALLLASVSAVSAVVGLSSAMISKYIEADVIFTSAEDGGGEEIQIILDRKKDEFKAKTHAYHSRDSSHCVAWETSHPLEMSYHAACSGSHGRVLADKPFSDARQFTYHGLRVPLAHCESGHHYYWMVFKKPENAKGEYVRLRIYRKHPKRIGCGHLTDSLPLIPTRTTAIDVLTDFVGMARIPAEIVPGK